MTTNHRSDLIKNRLENAFSPTYLKVIDESDQHVGHAGHRGGGRHFAIEIAAKIFDHTSRVMAHRQIYNLFKDMIPEQIHALRIKICSAVNKNTPPPPRSNESQVKG